MPSRAERRWTIDERQLDGGRELRAVGPKVGLEAAVEVIPVDSPRVLTDDDRQRFGSIAGSIEQAVAEGKLHPDFATRDVRFLRLLSNWADEQEGADPECEHDFTDPTNEVTEGKGHLVCRHCGQVQPPEPECK